jgi:ABC-type lipoprotein export system ATPase subunit
MVPLKVSAFVETPTLAGQVLNFLCPVCFWHALGYSWRLVWLLCQGQNAGIRKKLVYRTVAELQLRHTLRRMQGESCHKDRLLEIRGLGKFYGEQAVLKGVDFNLLAGERVAIMGPSGSGKSTLLNCVAGLEHPDAGEIRFRGQLMDHASSKATRLLRRGEITSVFQFFHLFPTLRAWENVEFPLLLGGVGQEERRRKVETLLDEVGLIHRARAWPSELSGGEMQRLAIARALITEPALILADEPTGSLDSRNSEKVLRLLLELADRHGTALLMVTHDAEAANICQNILHMADGCLVEEPA